MPKENVDGFDFTKDFTEQEMYDLLKSDIVEMCNLVYAPYKVVDDEKVNCGFMSGVLAYEINNKLYSVMKWHIYVKTGPVYTDYVLTITPFNCYLRKWGDSEFLCDEKRQKKLTKTLREIMAAKYGKVYVEAGKKFYKEVNDLRVGLEEDLFKDKKKKIEQKVDEELASFEL